MSWIDLNGQQFGSTAANIFLSMLLKSNQTVRVGDYSNFKVGVPSTTDFIGINLSGA